MKTTLSTLTALIAAPMAFAAPSTQVVFNFKRSIGESPVAALLERGNAYFMSLSTGGIGRCVIYGYRAKTQPCGTVLRLDPPDAQHSSWRSKLIYRFQPNAYDGAFPEGTPIPYDHGNLLVTTFGGGQQEQPTGTLVELSPPAAGATTWTESVLHGFGGSNDVSNPAASVHVDSQGNVFVAGEYGQGQQTYYGGVVELSPPNSGQGSWTETIVHLFNAYDGAFPASGILGDAAGNLYLTTSNGAVYGGNVIELSPPAAGQTAWTETLIHGFSGGANDGFGPSNGLVRDTNGNFYGLTEYGGAANVGVVYEVSPPTGGGTQWGFQVLYSFTGGADGSAPSRGLVRDAAGNLFATTTQGGDAKCQCGTLVELSPPQSGQGPYTETTIHQFTGAPDGAQPSAITVEDNGNLLVPTFLGGADNEGALVEVTNSGYVVKK